MNARPEYVVSCSNTDSSMRRVRDSLLNQFPGWLINRGSSGLATEWLNVRSGLEPHSRCPRATPSTVKGPQLRGPMFSPIGVLAWFRCEKVSSNACKNSPKNCARAQRVGARADAERSLVSWSLCGYSNPLRPSIKWYSRRRLLWSSMNESDANARAFTGIGAVR